MDYLIPTTEQVVENVARSLAKNRLYEDSLLMMHPVIETGQISKESVLESVERTFDLMWSELCEVNPTEKERYMSDARAAIASINIELLTAI